VSGLDRVDEVAALLLKAPNRTGKLFEALEVGKQPLSIFDADSFVAPSAVLGVRFRVR
jgi:hypothetical protein